MANIWKTLKVFLSSTFCDLELARDKLAHIFHNIENDLLDRHLTVSSYDLRWRDRYSKEPVVEWCLKMLEKCDYFIAILGNRYGWRPPDDADGNANSANISITEMEINHALKKIAKERRFFCFTHFHAGSTQESAADLGAIDNLKQRLRENETVYDCQDMMQLLSHIDSAFRKIIDNDYPQGKKVPHAIHSYKEALTQIIAEKSLGFVGRENYLQKIDDFVRQKNRPNYLVIQAAAGTGKSALVAYFAHERMHLHLPVITHFMSMGGDAREISGILESIGEQLRDIGVISDKLSADLAQRQSQIRYALETTEQNLLLLIDGLDETSENARNLRWLPRLMPANVRIIITTRLVDTLEPLEKYPYIEMLELPPLKDSEISEIIKDYVKHNQLQLTPEEIEELLKRSAGNPLYLKVALDEITSSGIAVGQLALTVDSLFDQILSRLTIEYSQKFQALQPKPALSATELLANYLGFIAAGRFGIPESELKELLPVGDDFFLSVGKALRNFVIVREGLLTFFHPEFERKIKIWQGKSGMRIHHHRLAKLFEQKGITRYSRSLEELPYQLQCAEQYHKLLALLTDLQFLEAKVAAGMVAALRQDFDFALNGLVVRLPEEITIEIDSVTVSRNTLVWLGKALERDIQFLQLHPDCLFQSLWNLCYWHDAPEAKNHYVGLANDEQIIAPWDKTNAKTYRLLEKWRQQKEENKHPWLRSVRPLPDRLDCGLLKIFRGHEHWVNSVCFSTDGAKIVSGSGDKTVRIWDSITGKLLLCLEGHDDSVENVGFNPDSSRIVSGSKDKTIKLWDSITGELLMTLSGHDDAVRCVGFSPDSSRIVSGSKDKTIKLWDSITGELLMTLSGHDDAVRSVGFSPDSSRIVSGSKDKTIKLWDSITGELLMTLSGHDDAVNSVAFSPKGDKFASSSRDKTIRIWDSTSGNTLLTLKKHEFYVYSVSFAPDGNKIVSGSMDNTIRVWDSNTGKQISILKGHESYVVSVHLSQDGNKIVSGSMDNTIRVWDSNAEYSLLTLVGHNGYVRRLSFSADASKIASGGEDQTVKVWDSSSGQLLMTLPDHDSYIDFVHFSVDATQIVSGAANTLRIWDIGTGKLSHTLKLQTCSVESVSYSPDNNKIVIASRDKLLRIWTPNSQDPLLLLAGHEKAVRCACYSPDGSKIVSGGDDKSIRIWDSASGQSLLILTGHEKGIAAVAYSPDGTRIVSGGDDKSIRVWDSASGKALLVLAGHEEGVTTLAYSPDGSSIVSGGAEQMIKLWNSATGELIARFKGHQGTIRRVSYSPDGQKILSTADDKIIRVWDIASATVLLSINAHDHQVRSARYSPDGNRIVSGARDKMIKLWNSTTGELILGFKAHDDTIRDVNFSLDGRSIVSAGDDKTVRVWDSQSGKCLKVLDVVRDIPPIYRHFQDETYRVIDGVSEIILGHQDDTGLAGVFPGAMEKVSVSGKYISGCRGNYVYIIELRNHRLG